VSAGREAGGGKGGRNHKDTVSSIPACPGEKFGASGNNREVMRIYTVAARSAVMLLGNSGKMAGRGCHSRDRVWTMVMHPGA
jgi:hypothetical protein